jgi:hypothetical protein
LTSIELCNYYGNRMKKIVDIIFSILVAFAFMATAPVYATSLCPNGNFGNLCNIKPQNAGGIVGAVIQFLLIIAIIVSLFFLIWGGIRYISSGGDKGRVDQARGTLIAAVVGLIISLLAFFILNLILVFITGQGITNMQIPTLLQ